MVLILMFWLTAMVAALSTVSSSSELVVVLASLKMFVMKYLSDSLIASSVREVRSTVSVIVTTGMIGWSMRRIKFIISGLNSLKENEVACTWLRSSFSV